MSVKIDLQYIIRMIDFVGWFFFKPSAQAFNKCISKQINSLCRTGVANKSTAPSVSWLIVPDFALNLQDT